VLLKKIVSWLKRGQKVPFLREICPLKKMTPKYNAASGIIAGELLRNRITAHREDMMGSTVNNLVKFCVCKLSCLKRDPSIQKGTK
jgi:hypothetical protein